MSGSYVKCPSRRRLTGLLGLTVGGRPEQGGSSPGSARINEIHGVFAVIATFRDGFLSG
jgi:hypothetical protein